jgi:hypothetical protein
VNEESSTEGRAQGRQDGHGLAAVVRRLSRSTDWKVELQRLELRS